MSYLKKLTRPLTTILLIILTSTATAEINNPNQVKMFLISDPHVDITKRSTTDINPSPFFYIFGRGSWQCIIL